MKNPKLCVSTHYGETYPEIHYTEDQQCNTAGNLPCLLSEHITNPQEDLLGKRIGLIGGTTSNPKKKVIFKAILSQQAGMKRTT